MKLRSRKKKCEPLVSQGYLHANDSAVVRLHRGALPVGGEGAICREVLDFNDTCLAAGAKVQEGLPIQEPAWRRGRRGEVRLLAQDQ